MASLWGQISTCDSCDFRFVSHHSSEIAHIQPSIAGFFEAACEQCAHIYLFPTVHPRGPMEGELLELCIWTPDQRSAAQIKKKVPRIWQFEKTSQYILFEQKLRQPLPLAELICTHCGAPDSIVIEFATGQPCPACKTGVLDTHY